MAFDSSLSPGTFPDIRRNQYFQMLFSNAKRAGEDGAPPSTRTPGPTLSSHFKEVLKILFVSAEEANE